VVAEAGNGAEAVTLTDEHHPDVILMDLRMPEMDGLTAITELQKTHPQVAVVILTTYSEDELMVRGLRAGALGYLLKDTDRETLLNTIRAAARGELLLKPEIVAKLLAVAPKRAALAASSTGGVTLTGRELEILHAVASGERNKEVAHRLGITERTVKAHLTSIYNKFGVDSRAAAIAVAARRGLLA